MKNGLIICLKALSCLPFSRKVDPSSQGGGTGQEAQHPTRVSLFYHLPLISREATVVVSNAEVHSVLQHRAEFPGSVLLQLC